MTEIEENTIFGWRNLNEQGDCTLHAASCTNGIYYRALGCRCNHMARNIFNEWYAAQTSKKIRAVNQMKAANGKRVSSTVPYGYEKNPENKEEWLIDEEAATVVKKIFELCIAGKGPLQISKQLEREKILIPTAYFISQGKKVSYKGEINNPYRWDQKTIVGILENRQYTGCTVNFMTTSISYKVHKTIYRPKEEWQIIPNTQQAIIDEVTFNRVQELRESRRRNTATGKTSLFSGLSYCADCKSKIHFCAAKSLKPNQEFFRCSEYKSGRGNCTIHFIRNVILEKIVLKAIVNLANFVKLYEPIFLYLLLEKNNLTKEEDQKKMTSSLECSNRRIKELDKLIERIYEDNVLGKISDVRFARMSSSYDSEQKELIALVSDAEKRLNEARREDEDLGTLLSVLRKCTDISKLDSTIVNRLIKRIEVHNNDKYDGHCHVNVDIFFTAVGLFTIPDDKEIEKMMEELRDKLNKENVSA